MDWTRGRVLGHGSTATVSLATSHQSDDVFAVKSAELSNSEFLQKEQNILSSISSPYIVSYKGCDITKEGNKIMYNLLLEYMPGGSLLDTIQLQGGRLSESMIRRYTWQLLEGLNYLHSIGIVHCDIKGRNILIGQEGGEAKIADFGCAKRVDPEKGMVAGNFSGTPMFMAPEVARGESQGYSSDIWSLGCTIIEMATGSGPWPNSHDPMSVIYRVGYSGQVPEFPCWLSEEAKDFLEKCLRKDPKQRWTTSQLLKHPFMIKTGVQEFVTHTKQTQESNVRTTYSPTSILDQQCLWNSFNESEASLETHHDHPSSIKERIRRLALVSSGPSRSFDDEDWVTVRVDGGCGNVGDVDGRDDVIGCGGLDQKIGLLLDGQISWSWEM